MRSKLIRHFQFSLRLALLAFLFAACDWDGDIYMDATVDSNDGIDNETGSASETETDTATESELNSRATDSVYQTSDDETDSQSDSQTGDDDTHNDTDGAWSQDVLSVMIGLPPELKYWKPSPEEVCAYLLPEKNIENIFPADYSSVNLAFNCTRIGEDEETYFFARILFGDTVTHQINQNVYVAALLFRDGNHSNDAVNPDEDFFSFNFHKEFVGYGTQYHEVRLSNMVPVPKPKPSP